MNYSFLRTLTAIILFTGCQFFGQAKAKYVFYFIGDGMGMGHVNAAQYYNRMVLGNDDPLLMMQFPVASHIWTYSASSPVTDSAAAGTALASGSKTRNYMIGLAPDSVTRYESVATKLKNEGWGVGVLTSSAPDDATPAAFYAHQPNRGMLVEIDNDAIGSGFDFLGGASLRGLTDREGNDNGTMDRIKDAGITVVYGADAAAGATDAKALWMLSLIHI